MLDFLLEFYTWCRSLQIRYSLIDTKYLIDLICRLSLMAGYDLSLSIVRTALFQFTMKRDWLPHWRNDSFFHCIYDCAHLILNYTSCYYYWPEYYICDCDYSFIHCIYDCVGQTSFLRSYSIHSIRWCLIRLSWALSWSLLGWLMIICSTQL